MKQPRWTEEIVHLEAGMVEDSELLWVFVPGMAEEVAVSVNAQIIKLVKGEVEAKLDLDYTPYEPAIMNPPEKAYPGCDETLLIEGTNLMKNDGDWVQVDFIPELTDRELEAWADRVLADAKERDDGWYECTF
jgi:hypothetical protein